MIQTIVTAAILYIATAVDLLVILLIFFAKKCLTHFLNLSNIRTT